MRMRLKGRRGTVAVVVAISLVGIIGVVAIAVEGGLLLDEHGRAQAAADAAAMAAAEDLYTNYFSGQGLDPNGTAKKSALSNAKANGYANDGTRSVVTVNIPPLSGPYSGQANYVEVIIQYNQPRGFSNSFGSGDLPVKARAVAIGLWNQYKDGILVLDPTGSGSLSAVGNGTLLIGDSVLPATPVIVNSNSPTAINSSGNGDLTAPVFYVTGVPGTATSGNGRIVGTVYSGSPPVADPLRYLPVPDYTAMTVRATSGYTLHGQGSVTINPGLYIGGIKATGGTITMNPGIYYLQGGGISLTGQASLVGNNVMIYNDSGGSISLAGQGSVTITPPTSGIYQGMAIFQDRNSTNAIALAGNGNMNIGGTFYAASAKLSITGNSGSNKIGSQYVSYDLGFAGNGTVTIDYTAAPHPRNRVITLVE